MLIPTLKKWGDTATRFIEPPKEAREECGKSTYSLQPIFPKMFEEINFATYFSGTTQVLYFVPQFLLKLRGETVEPALQRIYDDINELSKEEDYDGHIF